MDADLKPSFLLPPSAEVAAEEAAAAGVELTAVEFFPVVVILGMMVGAAAWLRPSVEAQSHSHHSLLYNVVTWPARKLIQGVTVIEHRVMHAMSHWLGPKVGMVAHAINAITHEIHVLTQVVADTADNTHEALTWLRHQVIPQLIEDALTGLRARVTTLERGLATVNERFRTVGDEIATQLEQIGKTVSHTFTGAVGQLAVAVVELWQFVHETVVPQVKKLQEEVVTLTTQVKQITTDLYDDVMPRLVKLEELLAPAAIAAAIAAVFAKSYSYLTCTNTKTVATELCAADPALVRDALALFGGALVLLSLQEYVRIMQGVMHETAVLTQDLLHV